MCEAADQVNRPVKLCQISFDDSLWESLWLLKGSEFTGKGTANWLYGFKKTRSGLFESYNHKETSFAQNWLT